MLNNPLAYTDPSGFCLAGGPACPASGLGSAAIRGVVAGRPNLRPTTLSWSVTYTQSRYDRVSFLGLLDSMAAGLPHYNRGGGWGGISATCSALGMCLLPGETSGYHTRWEGNWATGGSFGQWRTVSVTIPYKVHYYAGFNETQGQVASGTVNGETGTDTQGGTWENVMLSQVTAGGAVVEKTAAGFSGPNFWIASKVKILGPGRMQFDLTVDYNNTIDAEKVKAWVQDINEYWGNVSRTYMGKSYSVKVTITISGSYDATYNGHTSADFTFDDWNNCKVSGSRCNWRTKGGFALAQSDGQHIYMRLPSDGVAAHEFGHVLHLNHNDKPGAGSVMRSTAGKGLQVTGEDLYHLWEMYGRD